MPIGKIDKTAGKGADYSAGSVNIEAATSQAGARSEKQSLSVGKGVGGKGADYSAGSVNIDAATSQSGSRSEKQSLSIDKGVGGGSD